MSIRNFPLLGLMVSPRHAHMRYAAELGLAGLTPAQRREAYRREVIAQVRAGDARLEAEARARARHDSADSIQGAPEVAPVASFEVEIQTPKVPETLTVKLPTQTKGSPMALHRFSTEQVQAVAEDWTKQLMHAYEKACAKPAAEPKKRVRKKVPANA